jgi:hypothetical protein
MIEKDYPTFYDIFNIFNCFNNGVTVEDINKMNSPHEKNIDLKYEQFKEFSY